MARIFLSYSRKDADAAKVISASLSERDHDVWWDKHISGGSRFAAEIEQALTAADVVLVLWSKDAIASAWVLDEAAEGRDTDRLLPVSLDDCKPPLGFRQFQTIPTDHGLENALDNILKSIAAKCDAGLSPSATRDLPQASTSSAVAIVAKARNLQERGDFKSAVREIQAALVLDPDNIDLNKEAGSLHYVQGRAVEAIAFYEKAALHSKSDHESPAMLVSCYRAIKDDDGMDRAATLTVERAEQAIAAASSNGAAFASGAKGLAALGHRDRARKWIRKALSVDPGNLRMRYNLAATLVQFLEEPEAALDVIEPFVEAAQNRIHLALLQADPAWERIHDTRAYQAMLGRASKCIEAIESTNRL
ncbi:hypothetical protein GCM10022276_28880 [Sphingomonas limnosediminicola]|uniref:TIR domain-containing protein n=1 Tax=Sphingomonas limnosediminicola TaxID=940133 RepID=A0ABP7LUV7_9SPHN